MSIRRVVPNLPTDRLEETKKFFTDFLGFHVAMDMDWIITVVSPSNPTAQINLIRAPAAPKPDPPMSLSIEVADVDAMHAKAVAQNIPIIYPLTNEPWKVRRFHVTDPNGVVINVMAHLT